MSILRQFVDILVSYLQPRN